MQKTSLKRKEESKIETGNVQCLETEENKMFQEGRNVYAESAQKMSKIRIKYRPYSHEIYQHENVHYS